MVSGPNRTCAFLLAVSLTMPLAAADRTVSAEAVEVDWTTGPHRYDGAGNIMQIGPNHLQRTDTYRYDQVGRLTAATAHTRLYANEQTFRYDAFGNLLRLESRSERDGAAPITANTIVAVEPKTNRTHAAPCAGINDGSCVFGTWDDAGNQTWSSAGVQYEFDALGMMVLLRSGAGEQQYVYDANNERIATITPLDGRYTLRDLGGKVVRELKYDGGGWTWQKDYVYRDGTLLAAILPDGRHHFHLDHLGTPRLITDDRGMTVAAHTYWPFGTEAPGSEVHPSERMKFTGHERDFGPGPAQDLDYMHARYYNPNVGRFLVVDAGPAYPVRPQTWNRYSYVANNPINMVDPTGNCGEQPEFIGPTINCVDAVLSEIQAAANDLDRSIGATVEFATVSNKVSATAWAARVGSAAPIELNFDASIGIPATDVKATADANYVFAADGVKVTHSEPSIGGSTRVVSNDSGSSGSEPKKALAISGAVVYRDDFLASAFGHMDRAGAAAVNGALTTPAGQAVARFVAKVVFPVASKLVTTPLLGPFFGQ